MTKAEFIACFERNVAELETAYNNPKPGSVYVWPKFWLAAKFDGDSCRAVSVAQATRVNERDNRVFTNGHGERAILMSRQEALRQSLINAREILAKAQNYEIA